MDHGQSEASARFVRSPVRRSEPKAFAVPRDHGFRFHDANRRFPVHPPTREPNPEKTVKGRQLESPFLVSALENEKLMVQGDYFCLQSNSRTEEIRRVASKKTKTGSITQSLLSYCVKCNLFSENEFLVGTGSELEYRDMRQGLL